MAPSGDEGRASGESGETRGSTLWVREGGGCSLWVLGRCGTSKRGGEREKKVLKAVGVWRVVKKTKIVVSKCGGVHKRSR